MAHVSSYLLLPGSDGRGAIWRQVAEALSRDGHRVATYHGWPGQGLTAQAADVAASCRTGSIEVLVGWSYSGLVAATAAAQIRLRQVVHVDSLLPGFASDHEELAHLLSPVVLSLVGHDIEMLLTAPSHGCPVQYIECLRRPAKPAFRAVERSAALARSCGWTVLGIDADHRAMASRPTELASLLDAVSR